MGPKEAHGRPIDHEEPKKGPSREILEAAHGILAHGILAHGDIMVHKDILAHRSLQAY